MKIYKLVSLVNTLVITMFIAIGLTNCGGGGGGSDSSNNTSSSTSSEIRTGVFIDGLVEGLAYQAASRAGLTDDKGGFTYVEDEEVVFSIGDIILGAAIAKPIMTPLEILAGGNDQNSPVFINVIRLLQTLDYDNNPQNGIQIPEQAHMFAVGITLPLEDTVEQFENNQTLLNYIQNATGKSGLISQIDAIAHWEETYYGNMFFHATTDNPAMPIVLMAYDGSRMVPTYDNTGLHTGAIIITPKGDEIVLELNSDGTPKSLVVDKTYITFSGYTDKTVDIGVINEDGSVEAYPGLMNFYSNLVKPEAVVQKAGLYLSRISFASTVNTDLRSVDLISSAMVTNAVEEQLTNLYKNGVLLKGSKVNTNLKEVIRTAVIKELTLRISAKLGGVDINNLRAVGDVADIVFSTAFCVKGDIAECASTVVTSVKTTAEAAGILVETYKQNGILQKMANELARKKLLSGPTIQAEANIVGLVHTSYSQDLFYDVELVKQGNSSVNNEPVTKFTINVNGVNASGVYDNYTLPAGTNVFTITGTDDYGLSTTIETSITIPDRPMVPESVKLEVMPPSLEVASQLTEKTGITVSFRITSDPKYAMPSSLNLDSKTGKYTYSAIPNSGESDSFTYVAEHLLTVGCIPSDSFKCIVSSNEGRVNINITVFLDAVFSMRDTVTRDTRTYVNGPGLNIYCGEGEPTYNDEGEIVSVPDTTGDVYTYSDRYVFDAGEGIVQAYYDSNTVQDTGSYNGETGNFSISLSEETKVIGNFTSTFSGTMEGALDTTDNSISGTYTEYYTTRYTPTGQTANCTAEYSVTGTSN